MYPLIIHSVPVFMRSRFLSKTTAVLALLFDFYRIDMPNFAAVVLDGAVAGKIAGFRDIKN